MLYFQNFDFLGFSGLLKAIPEFSGGVIPSWDSFTSCATLPVHCSISLASLGNKTAT